MPWQNTKLAMETASQLKQPSAPQALVAIPSLVAEKKCRDVGRDAIRCDRPLRGAVEVDQQGSGTEAPNMALD